MCIGDVVYLPIQEGFVKYIIKKIFDNSELLVISYKSKSQNWVNCSDVITDSDLRKIYDNEIIYE